jgi:hypothetical protein
MAIFGIAVAFSSGLDFFKTWVMCIVHTMPGKCTGRVVIIIIITIIIIIIIIIIIMQQVDCQSVQCTPYITLTAAQRASLNRPM